MSVAGEFVKWMVLLMIAGAVALFLAIRIAGADGAPGLLPGDINRLAKPMPESTRPFFPEVGPPLRTNDPNQVLWRIIELHRMGQVDEAIAQWQQADEMCGVEVWRHVAVAAAYLQAGDLEQAEVQLDAALEMEPQNAPAHYFVGLLRLAQARGAENWPDMIGPPAMMFIALPAVVPNTRGMYELMAMQEFAKAIEFAEQIDLDAPLAPDVWAAEDVKYLPLVTPTVGDLLTAIGADHYPARAHNALGMMFTERGSFEEAEEHLDAAAAERMNGTTAYRELGAALEAEARYDDARRVYLKAFRTGDVNLLPVIKAFINGWKAADGG
jgi:tetratricopeptide (TPR) repeat protein